MSLDQKALERYFLNQLEVTRFLLVAFANPEDCRDPVKFNELTRNQGLVAIHNQDGTGYSIHQDGRVVGDLEIRPDGSLSWWPPSLPMQIDGFYQQLGIEE